MKTYKIYKFYIDPDNSDEYLNQHEEIYAIKCGFSWPAFIFNILWVVRSLSSYGRFGGLVEVFLGFIEYIIEIFIKVLSYMIVRIAILMIVGVILIGLILEVTTGLGIVSDASWRELYKNLSQNVNISNLIISVWILLSFLLGLMGNSLLEYLATPPRHEYMGMMYAESPTAAISTYEENIQHEPNGKYEKKRPVTVGAVNDNDKLLGFIGFIPKVTYGIFNDIDFDYSTKKKVKAIILSAVASSVTYAVTHTVFGFGISEASVSAMIAAGILGAIGYTA